MILRFPIPFLVALLATGACATSDRPELRERARLGDAEAQFALALALDHGDGMARDLDEAAIWYAAAAGHGHAEATNNLAYLSISAWG